MDVLRVAYKLIKWFIIFIAIVYIILSVVALVVDFFGIIDVFFSFLGIDADIFFSSTYRGPEEITSLFDTMYYNILYAISLVSAVLGTLVLSRRRTTEESIAMLVAYIIPPERKSWGRIIDSTTTRPVPFATIYLEPLNAENKVIRTVADSDGRYKLIIPDKKYNYDLVVRAPGYKDFHKELRTANSPIYGNEYIKDIRIHQVGKQSRKVLGGFNYGSSRFYWALVIWMFLMAIFSLLSSLYYVYAFPGSVYGALSLGLYIFSVSWNIVMIKDRLSPKIGKVLDIKTRKSLAGARVYIYKNGVQLGVTKSDSSGVINFKLSPGEYEVRVAKEGYKSASEETFQKVMLKADGYLDSHLFLQRTSVSSKDLITENPFA